MTPLDIPKIRATFDASKLPGEAICAQCSNYQSHCRSVLAGQKPFDGQSRHCYFGRWQDFFNVDMFGKSLKEYKRSR